MEKNNTPNSILKSCIEERNLMRKDNYNIVNDKKEIVDEHNDNEKDPKKNKS
jgi:hypothetical protein